MSYKDKERVMQSKSDSIEIMINDKVDEDKEEFLESLFNKYQIRLEISMRCSKFIY